MITLEELEKHKTVDELADHILWRVGNKTLDIMAWYIVHDYLQTLVYILQSPTNNPSVHDLGIIRIVNRHLKNPHVSPLVVVRLKQVLEVYSNRKV